MLNDLLTLNTPDVLVTERFVWEIHPIPIWFAREIRIYEKVTLLFPIENISDFKDSISTRAIKKKNLDFRWDVTFFFPHQNIKHSNTEYLLSLIKTLSIQILSTFFLIG